jgi:hypothetical protein
MAGTLTADQLLSASAASRQDSCRAHYFIAVTMLADGKQAEAGKHFRAALATHAMWPFAYDLSWAFLGRMTQDPGWPAWLPAKK